MIARIHSFAPCAQRRTPHAGLPLRGALRLRGALSARASPSLRRSTWRGGFTLVEILIVCTLMAVLAGLCMDMFQGNKYEDVEAGVRILRADIDYARVLALSNPTSGIVLRVFDDGTGYRIANSATPTVPLEGPNGPLSVTFGSGRAESCPGLLLTSSASTTVTFGPFGGISDPVPTLTMTLSDSGERATLVFDAFTGDSTVTYQPP